MKRYLEHIKSKEPHERRRHALQLSGVITGLFFFAWLATLSVRLGSAAGAPDPNVDPTQVAAAALAGQTNPNAAQLQVSTTSVYSY